MAYHAKNIINESIQRKMNNQQLVIDKFLNMESEYDLFSLKIGEIKIWQYIRITVMNSIIIKQQNLILNRTGQKKTMKGNIFTNLKHNPYCVTHKDILFIGLGRRVYESGKYEDPVLSEMIRHINYSYYLFEYPYSGQHEYPFTEKNVKYCEMYRKDKTETGRFPNEIRKFINVLVGIIEKEFCVNFSQVEKKSIFNMIFWVVTEGELNYKKYCNEILKKIRPKVLIVVNPFSIENMIWIREAKRQKIPSIEIAHGIDSCLSINHNFKEKIKLETYPNYIWVYGEYDKKSCRYPISRKKIIPVGCPNLEKKKRLLSRNSSKTTVTFVGGASLALGDYAEYLCRRLDLNQYRIIYKLHPHQYVGWEKYYPQLEGLQIEIIDTNMEDTYQCLADADFVIGISTTMLYEATYFNKKIGIVKEDNYLGSLPLLESEYGVLIESKEMLYNFVTSEYTANYAESPFFKSHPIRNINDELDRLIGQKKKKYDNMD